MNKIIRISLIVLADLAVISSIIMIFTVGLGSMKYDYYSEETHGDFIVRFFADRSECDIVGLSELGRSRKTLCIPKSIDGAAVKRLGIRSAISFRGDNAFPNGFGNKAPDFANNVIEKIVYYPDKNTSCYGYLDVMCPQLDKLLCLSTELSGGFYKVADNVKIYQSSLSVGSNRISIANVSYFWNYDGAADNGYYFIDDYDYGSKIEYIPQNPVREGYTFGGWYKDAECTDKWIFETDTLPERLTEIIVTDDGKEEEKTVYRETRLYAEWI